MTAVLLLSVMAVAASPCLGLNLVSTLLNNPNHFTLASLATKASLVGPLSSGNFTIFAPTDDAFNKVPQATMDSLNADVNALADLLKYHVISGNVVKGDVKNDQVVMSLAGTPLRLNIYPFNNMVTVEGVPVSRFDQMADNGVIHDVSGVLTPPSGSIVDIVSGNSDFSTLLTAVTNTGLVAALQADHLTVFAPTNEAFAKLNSQDLQKLLANPEILKEVLTHHVVDQTLYSAGLYDLEVASSEDSHHDKLFIRVRPSGVTVNGIDVTSADISATNGVIHVIDEVLVPKRVLLWLTTGILG